MFPKAGSASRTFHAVSESFAQSPEFLASYGALGHAQFVERVYQNVLGRPAEPAGRAYWLARLNEGMVRGVLIAEFSESGEKNAHARHATFIAMAYAGMLGRMPSTAEHGRWLEALGNRTATTLALIDALLQSAEYVLRKPLLEGT